MEPSSNWTHYVRRKSHVCCDDDHVIIVIREKNRLAGELADAQAAVENEKQISQKQNNGMHIAIKFTLQTQSGH